MKTNKCKACCQLPNTSGGEFGRFWSATKEAKNNLAALLRNNV